MVRLNRIQTDLTSGELDPGLAAREDAALYYSGARIIENGVPQPTGGVRGRGGWAAVGLARGPMTTISLAGKLVAAPLGSDPGNGIDDDEDTVVTLGAFATPDEVIYTLGLGSGSPSPLVAFDVILVKLLAPGTQVWEIQYSIDDIAFTTAGTFTVDSETAFSFRVAAPPGTNFGQKQHWRIRRSSGSAVDATMAEVRLHTEGALLDAIAAPFTFSIDKEYTVVLTGGNADIYLESTQAYVASAFIPHTDAQVVDITWAQSLDTMVLFHQDVDPYRLFRLGADDRWDFRNVRFDSVSQFPWGDGTVSGGINERQVLRFTGTSGGDLYVLFIDGVATPEIAYLDNNVNHTTSITTAMEGHVDITDVTVTNPVDNDQSIEFVVEDGNRPWPLLAAEATGGGIVIEITRAQRGREETAPLWDAAHGFPSCGTFYQARLWMGGFRDQPDIIVASRIGKFFDFDLDVDDAVADDSPMQFRADSDEQVTVVQIHGGRHLQFFTSSGEFYQALEPITPTNLGVKQTSRVGAAGGLPIIDVEGGTFFVARGGDAIREYLFVDTEQSYVPGSVSLLAGHLVAQPRSVTVARGRGENDAAAYYMANTGTDASGVLVPASAVTTLRAQQVTAFWRITSRGAIFRSFGAMQNGAVWAVVRRVISGTTILLIERLDPDYLLDSGRRFVNPDVDIFAAAEAQTLFTYTFTSPGTEPEVRVWTRAATTAPWIKIDAADYVLALGPKTVAFDTAPRASGAGPIEVRINRAITSITLDSRAEHLDGELIQVMVDRYPIADKTPASMIISLSSDNADFEVHYGYGFQRRIVTMPHRGESAAGPLYGVKKRIPESTIQVLRCGDIEVGVFGGNLSHVGGFYDSSGTPTEHIEAALITGSRDKNGMRGWFVDAALDIRGLGNMDFEILSVGYRVVT